MNNAYVERKRLGELLVEENIISQQQLESALQEQKVLGLKLGEYLIEKNLVTEEMIINTIRKQLNIPFIDLNKKEIPVDIVKLVPEDVLRKSNCLPYDIINGQLYVVMIDPLDYFTIENIKKIVKLKVVPAITSKQMLEIAFQKYFGKTNAEKAVGQYIKENNKDDNEVLKMLKFEDNAPAVKFVNSIIENAIAKKASDIHIEPEENELRIRYRIDGNLKEEIRTSSEITNSVISIIKIMCKQDITERKKPQDGRMFYNTAGRTVDLRVNFLPITHGEKVVLRILDKATVSFKKEALGFNSSEIETYDRLIKKPHGILLVTGPTGSGKTTTLYTIINELNREEKNIVTIEDPVEFDFKGINQVQVNPQTGMTFAEGLRAILRQDPNIVMIGEIRDKETADIAVRASLTGHLVLATLHTNDSIGSIPRLVDMGIEPFLISSTLIGVIAQRLVRTICPHCKQSYIANRYEKNILKVNQDENLILYNGKGCHFCNSTGYKGRTAIFEMLEMDKDFKEVVEQSNNQSVINTLVLDKKIKKIQDNCTEKVLAGITTIEELLQVSYL